MDTNKTVFETHKPADAEVTLPNNLEPWNNIYNFMKAYFKEWPHEDYIDFSSPEYFISILKETVGGKYDLKDLTKVLKANHEVVIPGNIIVYRFNRKDYYNGNS